MHMHAGSAFDKCVTFFFDTLTAGSMHTKRLPCAVCLLSLVLIAQAVFLLECRQTDTHTKTQMPLITLPTAQLPLAWVVAMHQTTPV